MSGYLQRFVQESTKTLPVSGRREGTQKYLAEPKNHRPSGYSHGADIVGNSKIDNGTYRKAPAVAGQKSFNPVQAHSDLVPGFGAGPEVENKNSPLQIKQRQTRVNVESVGIDASTNKVVYQDRQIKRASSAKSSPVKPDNKYTAISNIAYSPENDNDASFEVAPQESEFQADKADNETVIREDTGRTGQKSVSSVDNNAIPDMQQEPETPDQPKRASVTEKPLINEGLSKSQAEQMTQATVKRQANTLKPGVHIGEVQILLVEEQAAKAQRRVMKSVSTNNDSRLLLRGL